MCSDICRGRYVTTHWQVALSSLHCLCCVQRPLLVLLVREHKQDGVLQFFFLWAERETSGGLGRVRFDTHLEHGKQLLLRNLEAIGIRRVDHKNDCVCVWVIAPPVRSYTGLPAEIPHLELDVLVLERFHIEPDGRDGLLNFAGLEAVWQQIVSAYGELDCARG